MNSFKYICAGALVRRPYAIKDCIFKLEYCMIVEF